MQTRPDADRRGVAITHPVVFWAQIINERPAFARAPLSFGHLAGGQSFQVIVPPIKPAPEKGRKAARFNHRHHEVEPLRSVNGFTEPVQNCFGFFVKRLPGNIALVEASFQPAQFVHQHAAGHEDRDFGRAGKKSLVFLNRRLSCFCFWFQSYARRV